MPPGGTEPSGTTSRRSERGFSEVELVVTILVALLVIVIPLTWIVLSIRQSNQASSRALSSTQAEAGLLQLTRDLREVSPGTTATFTWDTNSGASATFSLPTPGNPGTPEAITWTCTFGNAGTCTRQVGNGPQSPQIRNVLQLSFAPADGSGNALPSPATNPAYVGITVQVQNTSALDPTETHTTPNQTQRITLADGAYLRNSTS
jgi:hypothetical protein